MKQIIHVLHITEISSTSSNCFYETTEQQRDFVRKLLHGIETTIRSTRYECMGAAKTENIALKLVSTCKTMFLVGGMGCNPNL